MNTWGSARRWSPAYTASRTDRHTQCSSCGYSCRRWSSWCRHRSEGTLWSPLHLQQQSQCVRGDHTFCNICSAQRSKITWEIKIFKKKGNSGAEKQDKRRCHLLRVLHWRRTAWRHRCRLTCGGLAAAGPGHTSGWGATAADSGSRTPCHIPPGRSSAWDTPHSRKLSPRSWGEIRNDRMDQGCCTLNDPWRGSLLRHLSTSEFTLKYSAESHNFVQRLWKVSHQLLVFVIHCWLRSQTAHL